MEGSVREKLDKGEREMVNIIVSWFTCRTVQSDCTICG